MHLFPSNHMTSEKDDRLIAGLGKGVHSFGRRQALQDVSGKFLICFVLCSFPVLLGFSGCAMLAEVKESTQSSI